MKEIELGSGYRLVRRDAMNWELQQWREPAPDCGGRVAKSREAKLRGLGKYYQTLDSALHAAYELSLKDGDGRADFHAAMVEAELCVSYAPDRETGMAECIEMLEAMR